MRRGQGAKAISAETNQRQTDDQKSCDDHGLVQAERVDMRILDIKAVRLCAASRR
jgi:hypothetical protein